MTKKHTRSAELFTRALSVSPGGVHSPVRASRHTGSTPLFIRAAHGTQLIDADDNAYTDYCMAFGPLILGHANETVAAAAHAALDDGWSYGTAEPYSLELAELITGKVAWAQQLRFVNSGTEAVMSALRLARAATGRNRILKFAGCYHGHADAMLIAAGSGLVGTADSAGVTEGVAADTLVADLDNLQQVQAAFAAYGSELAAVIIEPLPANHGLLPQRREFLQEIAALCRQHGSLLIFDEVISGFRIGFGGCAEAFGITPDLVCWGKIIGGGFPVGAYAGTTEIMRHIAPAGDVYQAGTLSANPLAMRAGLATLSALTDGTTYRQLEKLGAMLEAGIAAIDHMSITREASLFWLQPGLQTDPDQPARRPADIAAEHDANFPAFHAHMLDAGVYLPPSPWEVSFLSSAHTESDIQHLLQSIADFQPGH